MTANLLTKTFILWLIEMSEEQTNNPSASEEAARCARQAIIARRAAREALKRLDIPEGAPSETDSRWRVFYQDLGSNIILSIELSPLTSKGRCMSLRGFPFRHLSMVRTLDYSTSRMYLML
jgi:hypothetical protein